MPGTPIPPPQVQMYSFQEVFDFEANQKKLCIDTNQYCSRKFGMSQVRLDIEEQERKKLGIKRKRALTRSSPADNMHTEDLEHESSTHVFKPAYIMSKAEELDYIQKIHLRSTSSYGYQSTEDRIGQIRTFTTQLLNDIETHVAKLDNFDNIPILTRLEIR